jgi:hypothetical protein
MGHPLLSLSHTKFLFFLSLLQVINKTLYKQATQLNIHTNKGLSSQEVDLINTSPLSSPLPFHTSFPFTKKIKGERKQDRMDKSKRDMEGKKERRLCRTESPFFTIFMHADNIDVALMVFGFIGAIGDGLSTPFMLLLTSKFFNDLGNGPNAIMEFTSKINTVRYVYMFLLSCSVKL